MEGTEENNPLKCSFCGRVCQTHTGLASHLRIHKPKHHRNRVTFVNYKPKSNVTSSSGKMRATSPSTFSNGKQKIAKPSSHPPRTKKKGRPRKYPIKEESQKIITIDDPQSEDENFVLQMEEQIPTKAELLQKLKQQMTLDYLLFELYQQNSQKRKKVLPPFQQMSKSLISHKIK